MAVALAMVGGGRSGASHRRTGASDPGTGRRQLARAAHCPSRHVGCAAVAGSPERAAGRSFGYDPTGFRPDQHRADRARGQRLRQRASSSAQAGRCRVAPAAASVASGRDAAAGRSSDFVEPRGARGRALTAAATAAAAAAPEPGSATPRAHSVAGGYWSPGRPAVAAADGGTRPAGDGVSFSSGQFSRPRLPRRWQALQHGANNELA